MKDTHSQQPLLEEDFSDQNTMHSGTKRGMLRPNGGHSRAPLFIIMGLVVACMLLLYNFYTLSTERSILQERFSMLSLKHKQLLKDKTDLLSKNEKFMGDLKTARDDSAKEETDLKDLNSQLISLRKEKAELDSQIIAAKKEKEDSVLQTDDQIKEFRKTIETAKSDAAEFKEIADQCHRNLSLARGEISKLQQTALSETKNEKKRPAKYDEAERRPSKYDEAERRPSKYAETERNQQKELKTLIESRNTKPVKTQNETNDTDAIDQATEKKKIVPESIQTKDEADKVSVDEKKVAKTATSVPSADEEVAKEVEVDEEDKKAVTKKAEKSNKDDDKLESDGGFDRGNGGLQPQLGEKVAVNNDKQNKNREFVRGDRKSNQEFESKRLSAGEKKDTVFERQESLDEDVVLPRPGQKPKKEIVDDFDQ